MNVMILDDVMANSIMKGLTYRQAVKEVEKYCCTGELAYYKGQLKDWKDIYNKPHVKAMFRKQNGG